MNKKWLIPLIFILGATSPVVSAQNDSLTRWGDLIQVALPISGGFIALAHSDGEGFVQAVEGAVYTAAATHALKFAVDAKRPDGSNLDSFPSGHTSAATQGAAFLAMRYGWKYGIPAYALAGVVGYSRVEARRHYWRDVAAGALLATGIQYAVTFGGASVTNVAIAPYFDGDAVGVALFANL